MLSPFVRRKLTLMYYRFDFSKDGVVKAQDLEEYGRQVAEGLKLAKGSPRYNKVVRAVARIWHTFFKLADRDNDNRVELEEYLDTLTAFDQQPDPRKTALTSNAVIAEAVDLDGDGKIEEDTFVIYQKPMGVSEEQARAAFKRLDPTGRGFLTRQEFSACFYDFSFSDDRSHPANWVFGEYAG